MYKRKIVMLLSAAIVFVGQSPALAQTFFTYHCADGSEFVAAFYEGDKRAYLQLDGKSMTLSRRVSWSGLRYVKRDIAVRFAKNTATLKRGKRLTECIGQ